MVDSSDNTPGGLYYTFTLVLDVLLLQLRVLYYFLESFYRKIVPTEPTEVKNEVILITGAAHGMGKELSLKYGRLGAKVVCWDINEKGNNEVVKEIKSAGGKAFGYVCNVTKRSEVFEVIDKVRKEVGPISIIYNNAGIMPCHSILDHTEAECRLMFDINVLAHIWIIQAVLPDFIKNKNGHIVALASVAGLFGAMNLVPYCGTKFAVRGMMNAFAEEFRSSDKTAHIKLTTIYPYMVDTGLCKRPNIRFPKLMALVKPGDAADAMIKAQRCGTEEASIPGHYLGMERTTKFLPRKANYAVADFVSANIDSDL